MTITRKSKIPLLKKSTLPWAKLDKFVEDTEAKLTRFAESMTRTIDDSNLKVHLGLMELEESWEHLQTKIEHQADILRRLESKALTKADDARLQAHLGKAEVTAAAERTRERLRKIDRQFHTIKVKADSRAFDVLSRLKVIFSNLFKRLEVETTSAKRSNKNLTDSSEVHG